MDLTELLGGIEGLKRAAEQPLPVRGEVPAEEYNRAWEDWMDGLRRAIQEIPADAGGEAAGDKEEGESIEERLMRLAEQPQLPNTDYKDMPLLLAERETPGDTIPEIVDETGVAGSSTSFMRDDTVPGLLLRKNGTAQDISGLMVGSASSGFQMRIAAAANENAERAATVHANPTIEIVPDGGVQVKFSTSTDATLEAVAAGLGVKLSAAGAIVTDGGGIAVAAGDGLTIAANVLKAKAKANGGLTVDADGIYMPAGAAGDVLYHNGTTWVVLNKDAGKYLKSGAAAVSWDTPTAASPLAVGDGKRAYRTDDHTTNGFVWKFLDGRTIGDSSSGADWADADAEDLFIFLWDHVSDTYCPVSGGRGASAAADWAASKTLTIPDSRGDSDGPRYPANAGGAGPAVGQTGGDATLQPGLTVAADLAGVETDTGVANIYINSNMSIPYPTPETTAGYVGVEDTGHTHPVTAMASALSSSTTAEFNVHPRYLAEGAFILAKVP